MIHNYQFRVFI